MSSSDLEKMFDLYRFRNQQDFHKVLLYFPFGFVLLLFRLAVGVLTWPLLALLPRTSKQRSNILKGTCLAFGVIVKPERRNRDENVKLLICNHLSVLDHIVIESALPCKQVNMCSHLCEWNFNALFSYAERHSPAETLGNQMRFLQHCSDGTDMPVAVFPEGTTTNGRYGLLKFNPLPFDTLLPVQPIVIQISHISFISISPSVMGTSAWCDLLWLLFVPYTVFTLRVLPSMSRMENEAAEAFGSRVQAAMAASLRILPTDFTSSDKTEYEKHLAAGTISMAEIPHSAPSQAHGSDMNKMARQVKEILPDVPMAVIIRDLGVTRSVDDTILRILEGTVHYTPESISSAGSSHHHLPQNQALPSLNTAVQYFGRTPKDRMMSYQERKEALIKAAKLRYLKKHGLTSEL